MAKKKDKTPAATFGSIALQNYTAQRGYEIGQDTSLGETLKPAVNLLGEYAKNAEIERGKFISSLPDDFKVELLPASGKESFTNFASDAKQKYSEAAGLAAKYSANPNSEQYRNAVKDMESIKGGLSNSFDSYTKLADLRQGYINNEKAKNKPIAMDAKEDQIYTAITEGDYKNFENTTNGLVYNYTDPITKDVEQIPFNELPNTKFVDSEMSANVIASVLKNPYAAGVKGGDMEASLSTANNEVQKLITTPEGYRQAVFNGFDGPKTKFIDYYVGEQFITNKDETFLNGINDINADGKITKDDMQNGVWSFKEGPEGDVARLAFEKKITDHQNDKNFDVKTQLSEFMNGIAKDKYLEGQAQKFKDKPYKLRGIGDRSHDLIQGDFDKLNNHEPISNYGNTATFMPVEGKPGLYYTLSADKKTRTEVTRDTLEKALDIFSIRGDFNTDPAKSEETNLANIDDAEAETTTTTTDDNTTESETTTSDATDNEVDGASGATIKVDPPKEIEYEKDTEGTLLLPKAKDAKEGGFYLNQQKGEADYGKGYKFENGKYVHVETVKFNENGDIVSRTPVAEEGEFRGDVDYTNQTEEAPIPRSSEIKKLRATLEDIERQAKSNGFTTFLDPKLREDIEEQIKLSDSYIKAIDDAYMNTGIINEEGVMRRGIPFISNPSFGGRGTLHQNYNSEKKRNKKLRKRYNNLPEPVGDKEPVVATEVAKEEGGGAEPVVATEVNNANGNNATTTTPSIDEIDYNEVTKKDVPGAEVITKIVELPELEQKMLNKIEEKEGWEFEGYIPTIGSGITVGYGIDLSQPPYNTAKGLKENGFSQEFIDMAVKEDVLGKTWKQLKADGKDVGERSTKNGVQTTFIKGNGGTDFLRKFQIPNSEQEKVRIYNLASKNTKKQTSMFENEMSEDVYLDYFTITHWGGAGLSDEKYDKLYNGGAFGTDGKPGKISSPSNRKAFVVTTLNRKLEKIKEEKGKISNEDYMQALKEARDSVPNFVTDSPGNAKTINNSIASISKSKETQA